MLDKSVRILNFDASLTCQKQLISRYNPQIIDLSDVGLKARLWMNSATRREIVKRLAGSSRGASTFIGSGDFHHVSALLLEQFREPICLFSFDFHPDWDTSPPHLGCGSWVSAALRNKNIAKCLLIGSSSEDISGGWCLQNGNLASLKNNRLEIYPYAHSPSQVFFKNIPENISLKTQKKFFRTKIYWNELKDCGLKEFFTSLVKRLPVKQVYISIDKDCLKKEYALTNWEEGMFSLEELLLMLKIIRDNLKIAGIDVVGDYSEISVSGRWKGWLSRLDHPRYIPANDFSKDYIDSVNQATNLKILEALIS